LFIPPSFAAFAVLTLALVATCIPKNPASAEKVAPIRKHKAVVQPIPTPKIINNIAANITSVLYSLLKKAIDPS
jgi:hypothetical protein